MALGVGSGRAVAAARSRLPPLIRNRWRPFSSSLPREEAAAAGAAAAEPIQETWEYDYDIMVVGGGVVGAALGCRLASSPVLQTLSVGKGDDSKGGSKRLRVCVVEGRPPPRLAEVQAKATPDVRVYSFTPSSCRLLEEVGVWGEVSKRAQPFTDMQVWDAHGRGHLRFGVENGSSSKKGSKGKDPTSGMGHIVEHNCLQASLFERLEDLQAEGRVSLLCPSQVEAISTDTSTAATGGGWGDGTRPMEVSLVDSSSNGEAPKKSHLKVRLLVAADGGMSKVRKLTGLPTWGWGYGQRAVVATVNVQHGDTGASSSSAAAASRTTAWQRFFPKGPLALLPLWKEYSSIVWSTTPTDAERLKALPEAEFVAELNAALQSPAKAATPPPSPLLQLPVDVLTSVSNAIASLSSVSGDAGQRFELPPQVSGLASKRLSFDLSLQQATHYTSARVALVGDAAHTIHPMAGQGLNLGMEDVDSLVKVLEEGYRTGADLGSAHLLKRYEADRKPKNLAMMGALNTLHHLFGSPSGPLAALRNTGIGVLNALGPLKSAIVGKF